MFADPHALRAERAEQLRRAINAYLEIAGRGQTINELSAHLVRLRTQDWIRNCTVETGHAAGEQ
jgi:hypothetical protein